MARTLSIRNAYSKVFDYMPLTGIWQSVLGTQVRQGAWLIYGSEKHGKTTLALMLADYLSTFEKVLYVSAEEGVEDKFIDACQRAGISDKNTSLKLWDYTPMEKLKEKLTKRKAERIVFLDNITAYKDELKGGEILKLTREFKNTLFIFIAHAKDGEPYTATAQACKRFAKVIIHVEGLMATVAGRCPGGNIVIDEERAALCWGDSVNQKED